MSGFRQISIDPNSRNSDGGNRLRISQLTTQLGIKQINDNAPMFVDREIVNGGTYSYVKAFHT